MNDGVDLVSIQALMGHSDIKDNINISPCKGLSNIGY